jgi:hypothetical protein
VCGQCATIITVIIIILLILITPPSLPPSCAEQGARAMAIQLDGEGMDDLLVASLAALCASYNKCLAALTSLRSGHMKLVHDYIIAQQKLVATSTGLSIEKNAGGKGTGGTDLMHFLKPMRDNCQHARVMKSAAGERAHARAKEEEEGGGQGGGEEEEEEEAEDISA